MQRIELVPLPEGSSHEAPGVWPAEVHIERGAERHTRETRPSKGSPPNPFTWSEACENSGGYAATALAEPQAAIIDAVGALERANVVGDVARLLAGTST